MTGARLVVIGTPIGNLGDLSPRGRDALAACDVIACEDTRRTGRLFQLVGLSAPRLVRLDDHTERKRSPLLIQSVIDEDLVLGVVSDAGMPGLSDPGAVLIASAIEAGLSVEVIPGPFAGAVALVASGLLGSDSRFVFEGFLPRRSQQRRRRLSELVDETRTVVFYESPNRVLETVEAMIEVFGPHRRLAVSKELTKLHERTIRGELSEVLAVISSSSERGDGTTTTACLSLKGEFVLVLEGSSPNDPHGDDEVLGAYVELREAGLTSRDAIADVATRFGMSANRVRRLAFSSDN